MCGGVLFHISIFATLASLIVSPWRHALPPALTGVGLGLTLMGALGGWIGILMRIVDKRLRTLSPSQ
jgi:hypothetical protein